MIEQIINSLKGELAGKLKSDFAIDNDKVDDAVDVAKKSIGETIQGEAQRGNIGGLMDVLKSNGSLTSNPIVTHMIRKYAGDLGAKLGLAPEMASKIANFAIPFILDRFQGASQDKGIDIGGLASMLGGAGGGSTSDKDQGSLGDALGGFFK